MTESLPSWINDLALDIHKVIKKYKAIARFDEMVNTWAKNREAEHEKLQTWRKQQRLHFEEKVAGDSRLQDEGLGPPEQGWRFEQIGSIEYNEESGSKHDHKLIQGWVPPELSYSAEPKITKLLPLSQEHELTLMEEYTVLAAVYNCG